MKTLPKGAKRAKHVLDELDVVEWHDAMSVKLTIAKHAIIQLSNKYRRMRSGGLFYLGQ